MATFHVYAGADEAPARLTVRHLEIGDLYDALRAGYEDFLAKPSHVIFLAIMYPLIGVVLAAWTSGANALPLLFPLASGFALLGPFAAIGLYEISRRRELGMDASWRHSLELRHSPALPSIAAVGVWLLAVFLAWLFTAQAIYGATMGAGHPASVAEFLRQVFTTTEGWALILTGNLVGLVFAVLVLSTTAVALPLLVDRDVGALAAIGTSMRVFAANPVQMLAWGLIVAALLAIGSIPVFAGLIVIMPILGHATWHLYRRAVAGPRIAA